MISLLCLCARQGSLELFLEQTWYDPRLIYHEKQFPVLNGIGHRNDIWLASPYLRYVVQVVAEQSFSDTAISIYANGSIHYVKR